MLHLQALQSKAISPCTALDLLRTRSVRRASGLLELKQQFRKLPRTESISDEKFPISTSRPAW
jgi:hypothetical protein